MGTGKLGFMVECRRAPSVEMTRGRRAAVSWWPGFAAKNSRFPPPLPTPHAVQRPLCSLPIVCVYLSRNSVTFTLDTLLAVYTQTVGFKIVTHFIGGRPSVLHKSHVKRINQNVMNSTDKIMFEKSFCSHCNVQFSLLRLFYFCE